ncbi:hypothetical protein GCM10012275_28690 [Longimycelium tulufanense]|uniref:Uncharacterized protein n=1 Tax=Longimycelium tulufanense TaxID=907463 RepID=A0A8J3C8G8_9PSEU|nr:hypothetical protein [Longimycelium tulufanense]GGM55834.1 hypothetical protein GCM10012275_28690 [Longimycelium tulufanense]
MTAPPYAEEDDPAEWQCDVCLSDDVIYLKWCANGRIASALCERCGREDK